MEHIKGDQVQKEAIVLRAVDEVQQDLAATCTLKSEIVWDILGPDQDVILCKKLEYMFPNDSKEYTSKQDIRRARRHNANVKEIRSKLFRNIWQQNSNNSSSCCMIFIDEQSRIYHNWKDFVENNELPLGTMVAPANGCYKLDDNSKVILEYTLTPAFHRNTLTKLDSIVSAASMVGQATTLVHPVFSVLTIASKSFETIRDYQKMSDQVKRGTSTNTAANLNLGGNIICLASSVATFGAYMSVSNDCALSFTAGMSIQAINSAAALINCTKLILTTYDIFTRYFLDEEDLNFSDIVAFGSSLLLLTNSINNMAITSKLGKIGGNTLRSILQTKIKAGLSLVASEVARFTEQSGGNAELMRLLNDIPYGDVLRNMHSLYDNLRQTGFLTSLSTVGAIALEMIPGLKVQIMDSKITQLDFGGLTKLFGIKFVHHIANKSSLIDVLNGMGHYFTEDIVQLLLDQTRHFIDNFVDEIDKQQNVFITTEMILFQMFSFVVKNYKDITFEYIDKNRDNLIECIRKYFEAFNPNHNSLDNGNYTEYSCNICGGYYNLSEI
ncbi:uncharacterized protein LOC142236863 isoform X2 [Haematobia irritans]|uniref:uncharacterized protein LOC142236863 isoform X2 n=1 Tax=Haematobia irritans TaxID=7368 RepID=UPI003F50385B